MTLDHPVDFGDTLGASGIGGINPIAKCAKIKVIE
jgi:hypothetical protein